MRFVRRLVMAPARLWARSLPFRVVASVVVATIGVLALTGTYLMDQSSRGVFEAKTAESVSEASSAIAAMQADLRASDLRGANVNVLLLSLAQEASDRGSFGNTFSVALEGTGSMIGSAGLDVGSVPAAIRQRVAASPEGELFTTPTTITYTDGRASEAGVVVAGTLGSASLGRYPIYFLFTTKQEAETLALVQRAAIGTALLILPLMALIMYLISLQILRPVRAARRAAQRMADGDLSVRMHSDGPVDTSGLARSMNHMASELSWRIAELEDLSRVQRQFVSDVSHELRTPLTTVRMAADVLYEERDLMPPVTARSADLLSREVDRFESLLTDLLEISRFDAGAAVLALEEVDLVDLVRDEVDAQRALADSFGIDLRVDAAGAATADVDTRRVRRIVSNLIANAIEHGEKRPVDVLIRTDAESVAVAVRDHGVGLTPEQSLHVFDRFWRADPSRLRTVGGTGLGLSIALENAQLHRGWLDVWGSPGQGAMFRLTLPRTPDIVLAGSPIPLPGATDGADGAAATDATGAAS